MMRLQCHGVMGAIGNTPLIRIESLSQETGCEIYGKAEFLNPGGSVKDRIALQIVKEAIDEGRLVPGALITEGTAGSTGVSLAMVAAAYGCKCFISMPDDAAVEKVQLLQALGAEVQRVRPVSISHPDHHVNVARRRAAEEHLNGRKALFADQFENPANYRAHMVTGEEIWSQTQGRVEAFVSGSGTGGTLAGVSKCLKAHNPTVKVYLVDPPGSGLYNKVTRGVMYTSEEAEGKRLRNPFDTITEGIGINRITHNFEHAYIDGAFKGSDREAVEMAQYLLRNDGLFVGSSAAMNCVGAVKVARALKAIHPEAQSAAFKASDDKFRPVIVTILCDGGSRHLSKFHNMDYLATCGLVPIEKGKDLGFIGA
ncbi:hypothetical protein CEUSTIGMA_g5117.t1 [Chlamydomonas eustigma]|uniref:cysteine synthase n=1 Tax=Chlamydomonas eustigma TaxID=1157962 RepID=A0A250X3L7_9CHLO|nr:hypothetical protein CEUSTIGMA_g5117.t1 [Chlamydomonas eustigma]|eukprot:GAX77674.1 hypothetical protein CEUSTIGMA_g5117.t1 [Chlamydomonas eustigma]